jgi:hypothetical protein
LDWTPFGARAPGDGGAALATDAPNDVAAAMAITDRIRFMVRSFPDWRTWMSNAEEGHRFRLKSCCGAAQNVNISQRVIHLAAVALISARDAPSERALGGEDAA